MNQLQKKLLFAAVPRSTTTYIGQTGASMMFMKSPSPSIMQSMLFESTACQSTMSLMGISNKRFVLPYHMKKYDDYFKPRFFDNPRRQPQTQGRVKYNTQDPLYMDEKREHLHGGIQQLMASIKDKGNYKIALRIQAFILYHMGQRDIEDLEFIQRLENAKGTVTAKYVVARHCTGALYGLYKLGLGSQEFVKFWEDKMAENLDTVHIQDVVEILKGFNMGQMPQEHMRKKMDEMYKKPILAKWKDEATYHQRIGNELMTEMDFLGYYDTDIWMKIHDDVCQKKRINNIHFYKSYFETFTRVNADPKNPLFKKLDKAIGVLSTKHYTEDRQWRYSLEDGGRMRSLVELIETRDSRDLNNYIIKKADVDERMLEQAKAIERKLKRLKLAKLDKNLFDEIIEEMMKEKKTLLEMQAELDVDEATIFDSQERIAKKKQQAMFAAQAKNEKAAGGKKVAKEGGK